MRFHTTCGVCCGFMKFAYDRCDRYFETSPDASYQPPCTSTTAGLSITGQARSAAS